MEDSHMRHSLYHGQQPKRLWGHKSFTYSVLAKELKSGAPPLLSIAFSFDVVERISQLCFDL